MEPLPHHKEGGNVPSHETITVSLSLLPVIGKGVGERPVIPLCPLDRSQQGLLGKAVCSLITNKNVDAGKPVCVTV